ncbi:MAG: DUF501 domain-containing protein [Synergistaceae bacterium]|nr:DUF501 domain-containing protein [Synergistaceae bacterium]
MIDLNNEWEKELCTRYVVSEEDADVILQQMKKRKFDPNLILGVTSRCLYGKPQVILCKSLHNGLPFPNSFWLSCPFFVKMAGQLESLGGVKKLETYIKENSKAEWKEYNRLHVKIRINLTSEVELNILKKNNLSLYKSLYDGNIGIGGIRINEEVQVKCLHLQMASLLSLGFHPGQGWFKENISSFCLNYCNAKPLRGIKHGSKRFI